MLVRITWIKLAKYGAGLAENVISEHLLFMAVGNLKGNSKYEMVYS